MLSNFHTHTVFCDGNNTAEEMVLAAIDKGFDTLGFSGHGYTDFDQRYCMTDTDGYIREIRRLKEAYAGKINILLGTEEDIFHPVEDRDVYDYIISSSHYFLLNGKYYPIDSSLECFRAWITAWDYNIPALTEAYYSAFIAHLKQYQPTLIGHFDLITKFDEKYEPLFLNDPEYNALAEKYTALALETGSIFELNTGAIARGHRDTPYPAVNLLRVIRKAGSSVVLCSDSHHVDTLDFAFAEARQLLKDEGFQYVYSLTEDGLIKDWL